MFILMRAVSAFFLMLMILFIIGVFRKKIKYLSGEVYAGFSLTISIVSFIFSENIRTKSSVIDNFLNSVFSNLEGSINEIFKIAQQGQNIEEFNQMKAEMLELLSVSKETYKISIPALIIIFSFIFCGVLLYIIKWINKIQRKDVSFCTSFKMRRMSKFTAFIFVVSYAVPYFAESKMISYAFSNMTMILQVLAFICGLSLIDFIISAKIRYAILRILIYFGTFIVLSPINFIIIYVCVFLGLLDSVYNYRLRIMARRSINKE